MVKLLWCFKYPYELPNEGDNLKKPVGILLPESIGKVIEVDKTISTFKEFGLRSPPPIRAHTVIFRWLYSISVQTDPLICRNQQPQRCSVIRLVIYCIVWRNDVIIQFSSQ